MAAAAGPATPQRAPQLPGAYLATPAPAPTIFAAQAASLRQNTQQPPADPGNTTTTSPQSIPPVELAARKINETLDDEARFPEMESYVTQGISGEYELPTNPAWMPFQKLKQYDLPTRLLDQANNSGMGMMIGIFPPLSHAWAALDNCLYLWDYTIPNPDLVGWEDNSFPITAVNLVPPREGVFVKDIEHMIVVTTSAEMILLGVAAQKGANGAQTIALYTTRMSIQVRGLSVDHVVATKKGRIFFVGSTSDDILEFQYQQDEGWFRGRTSRICHTRSQFSIMQGNVKAVGQYFGTQQTKKRINQVVIDDSRMLLYSLNSDSEIGVWLIRNELVRSISRPLRSLLHNAAYFTTPTDLLRDKANIASLSVIPTTESMRVGLVATTDTGCRLYLSILQGYYQASAQYPPQNMSILHIRFPPKDPNAMAAGASPSQQGQTSMTPYGNPSSNVDVSSRLLTVTNKGYRLPPGYFMAFMVDASGPVKTKVFCSAPDSARLKNKDNTSQLSQRFAEFGMFVDVPGEFFQVMDTAIGEHGATGRPLGFGNELATQFDEPTAEIAVVTSTTIQTVRRRRLVDIFATMMRYGSSNEEGREGDIKRFYRTYGLSETAATSLAVACGQGMDVSSDSRLTSITDPEVLEGARKVFIEHGGSAVFNANALPDNTASQVDLVQPSPRHAGMVLYISRLVRSVWKARIITEVVTPAQAPTITSTINLEKLRNTQRDLNRLSEFLEKNRSFIEGLNDHQTLGRAASRQDEIANQGEHRAMHSTKELVSRIIEGISFVVVLFDNSTADILAALGEDSRQKAKELTYESLFVSSSGRELAKELVKAIVNRNIASGSNVDTVAEQLRRRCGSFCSADDVVIFKAQEQVKRASEAGSQTETGRVLLNESQRLFQKVAGSLSTEHLHWAIVQYVQMAFFAGAIQLCLVVANDKDRAKRALGWYKDGMPDNDPRRGAFEARKGCYDLIFSTIQALDEQTANAPETMDGQYTVAAKRRNEAYDVVNSSEDAIFQICLYDWYVDIGEADRLLNIDTHHVVEYLKRRSQQDRPHADMLWRYYAHNNDYLQAASVQLDLARGFFVLTLEERIEYLSRARTNASTRQTALMDSRQSKQQLLREVSDLLDVANIQDDIYQRMKSEPRLTGERREQVLQSLNGPILPIDELFNQYADQAGYYDICILIYQVADHRNPADVKASWESLISQTDDAANALYGQQALSWESVGEKVRELGRRLNVSDATFPIQILVPMLERYFMRPHEHKPPTTWVLDLFFDLEIPHETLLPVMEQMYYGNEQPFVGAKRKILAGQIVYLLQSWLKESERKGERVPFGSEENASLVLDCVASLVRTDELDATARRDAELLDSSVQGAMR